LTRHPNSGITEKTRGTYADLIEKIPYLQELGITAVELLPVFQFDVLDSPKGLVNYSDMPQFPSINLISRTVLDPTARDPLMSFAT
jgi:glycosidase